MTLFAPTHSLVTWGRRKHVAFAGNAADVLIRARTEADATGRSLDVWRLEDGLRREKLAVVHPAANVARVVLVGCSKQKRKQETIAALLYSSQLFQKQMEYALGMASQTHVFVVSAKHQLLPLKALVKPYEHELRDKTRAEREDWAHNVMDDLDDRMSCRFHVGEWEAANKKHGLLRSLDVVLLMGRIYAEPLKAAAPEHWTFTEPLAGMQVGKRLQWLKRAIESATKGEKKT